jgi:hypothetical protein
MGRAWDWFKLTTAVEASCAPNGLGIDTNVDRCGSGVLRPSISDFLGQASMRWRGTLQFSRLQRLIAPS